MRIFGAVVFVPTSIPTWHMIPRKLSRTMGFPRRLRHSVNELALPSMGSSSIGVEKSRRLARTPMTR